MVVGISHFNLTQLKLFLANVFERISPKTLILQNLIFCRFHAKVKICLFLLFKCGYSSRITYIFPVNILYLLQSLEKIYPSFALKIGTNSICGDPEEQQ